jgi:cell division protein FtsB
VDEGDDGYRAGRRSPVDARRAAPGAAEGGLTRLVERALPIAVLVIAVVGAPVLIFSPQGLPRLRGLEKELSDVEDENAELRRDIEALRGNVERLRDDPAAVERIARDDLGLVRQSEVVFQFNPKR